MTGKAVKLIDETILKYRRAMTEDPSTTNHYCNNIQRDLKEIRDLFVKEHEKLRHRHSLLHDMCIEAESDRDRYHNDVMSLEKENEQLKQILKDTVSQLDAEISKDHSLYTVRMVVDVKMFRKIKELCK